MREAKTTMDIQSFLHKRNIRRLAAAALSLMLIMTALAGIRPAYAEAGQSVTQTSIDVAMLTGRNGTIMDRTVELQIQPTGAVKASEGSTVAIRSSIEDASGTPTISSVTFSHTDATVTSYEGIAIGANQKASVKQAVIDFSDVEFAGPGIYRYYVSEPTEGGNLTYDTQRQDKTNGVASRRTLDVYVLRYDDPQTGEVSNYIAGYVLHELDDLYEREAGTAADKSVGFVNEPALSNITLACKIVGNQAAIEKYFAFNIRIQSPSGAPFTTGVDWTEAAEALNPVPNPATSYDFDDIKAANTNEWTSGADGLLTKTVYLTNGQKIDIQDLPIGSEYYIEVLEEDYLSNWNISIHSVVTDSPAAGEEKDRTGDQTLDVDTQDVLFILTREGVVPTGIAVSALPGLILLAVSAIIVVYVKHSFSHKKACPKNCNIK